VVVVRIQLSVVTCATYPEKFIRDNVIALNTFCGHCTVHAQRSRLLTRQWTATCWRRSCGRRKHYTVTWCYIIC